MTDTAIKLFQDRNIRTQWDEFAEKWYFSTVDVVGVLAADGKMHETDTADTSQMLRIIQSA